MILIIEQLITVLT